MEKFVDIMSDRICSCRSKYESRKDTDVVQRAERLLKKTWKAAASMSVVELEKECNAVKVVGPLTAGEDTDHQPCHMPTTHSHHSIHIVNLDNQLCTCGIWQDFLYPCQHACAVYQKCKETTFSFILSDMVPDIYKFGYVKKTFSQNLFPACLDGIEYDGVVLPSRSTKSQPGRPRMKRMRNRSEFLDPED